MPPFERPPAGGPRQEKEGLGVARAEVRSSESDSRRALVRAIIAAHERVVRELGPWLGTKTTVPRLEAFDKALAISQAWEDTMLALLGVTAEEFQAVLDAESQGPKRE